MDPEELHHRFASEIAAAPDLGVLDAVRVAALGKAGEVTALLKTLGAMTPEQRSREGHNKRESVQRGDKEKETCWPAAACQCECETKCACACCN